MAEKNYFEFFQAKGKAVYDNANPVFQEKMQEMFDFEKEEFVYQTCEKLYNNIIIKKLLSAVIEELFEYIKTPDDYEKKNKIRLKFFKRRDSNSGCITLGDEIQVRHNGKSALIFSNSRDHSGIDNEDNKLLDYINEVIFATKNNISKYAEVLDMDESDGRNLEFECTLGELIYMYYMENKRYESETDVHEEYKKFQKKKSDY